MQCVNGHQTPDGNSFCGVCGVSTIVATPPPVQSPGFPTGYTPAAPTGRVQIAGYGVVDVASVGQRLAARAIDLGIVIVSYIALGLIGGMFFRAFGSAAAFGSVLGTFLWLVFWLCYEWLFIAYMGATIGKSALGITVVDQRTGGRLGLGPSFVRQLIPMVGLLFMGLGTLLVYISPLFDSSGRVQGWHDKAANDLVTIKPR